MCVSSLVGPVIIGLFPQEQEVMFEEHGGQPGEAPEMLSLFPLSKASPSAYSTYRMHFKSCFILSCVQYIVHYL
jgi:hypothetical protein